MVSFKWGTSTLTDTVNYPWLRHFPVVMQRLLFEQTHLAESYLEEQREALSENSCDCKFSRSFWLPCAHIIHAYEFCGTIDEPDWKEAARGLSELGFEFHWRGAQQEESVPCLD